jgi:hypothetical protein
VSLVDANVWDKHAASIFRAEVTKLRHRRHSIYRILRTKSEGREPIRENEYGKGIRTNSQIPSLSFRSSNST